MRRLLMPVLFLLVFATAAFGQFQIVTQQNNIPTGQVGFVYFTQLAASGYSGSLSWTLAGGTLPPDFVLDTSQTSTGGIICTGVQNNDGTVTCNSLAQSQDHGTWSFTALAHESVGGVTVARQFSITVLSPAAPNITSTSPLPVAAVGQPYSFQFQATGGNPPLRFIEFSPIGTFPPSFTLDTNTGIFSSAGVTAADLAGGNKGVYTFSIEAVDSSNIPSSARQFSLTVSQGLTINNNSPLPSGAIGVSYLQQLSASGGTGSYSWQVVSGSLATIGLTMSSGGLIYGFPSANVQQLQFTVQVTDVGVSSSSLPTATKTFSISIVSSQVSIVQTTLPFALQGQPYSTTLTAQGGVAPYTWSLGSNSVSGLSIGSTTGILSGTATNAPGAYSINVIVNDSAGGNNNFTFTLQVASNLSITTTSLSNATTGQSYTSTVSAAGGQGPYAWSVAAGNLPPGLTLQSSSSSSVNIAGTPTSNGTYQFTIRVTDNGARVATAALQILVGSNISITTTTLPNGSQGITYNQILGATGGQTPYTWSVVAGTLPAGLTLTTNPDSTATLNGSPTGQGASNFTIQVKDAQGSTAVQTFTVTIGVPLVITNVSVQNGVVGVAYTQPLGASGGTPAYSWSVVSGTLPGGLNLNSSNGLLSGTPTVSGNYSFTVQVTDSSSATAQRQYSIAITSQLTLQPGTFNGQVGSPFSLTLTAAGGVPPYSFVIQSGSLPPGINFSSGSFSGTPTTAGTSSVVAQVTDSSNSTATANITITVTLNQPPTLSIGSITGVAGAQPALSLTLAGTYPVDLTGTLVLTFGSSVGGGDGTVSFTDGTTTTPFTIPHGQSVATFLASGFGLRTGTTAGSITLRVTKLTAGATDVTPASPVQQVIVIPKSGPVITNVSCAAVSGGFSVTVTGYSTTHDMVTGTFTFTAPSGVSLATNSNSLLVQLATPFQTWYASSSSTPTGGQFLLTVPFTGSGTTSLSGLGVSAALGNTLTGSNILAPATCK